MPADAGLTRNRERLFRHRQRMPQNYFAVKARFCRLGIDTQGKMRQYPCMDITEAIATKVRDTVAAGLVSGIGKPIPGQMCVEAAVCYALGLPHGDDPGCVAQSVRRLKIRLNDASWSSPQARAEGLKRLALVQLGSAGVLDDHEFRRRVVDVTIRRAVPIGLRAAARMNPTRAADLEDAAMRCEREGSRESCEAARVVARASASAYAYASAAASAYASASASAYAYAAAAAAAYASAYAADAAAAVSYAVYAAAYAAEIRIAQSEKLLELLRDSEQESKKGNE